MNNYEVINDIGKGKFGNIKSAIRKKDDRIVALKIINNSNTSKKEFEKEYNIIKKLAYHPNIIEIYNKFSTKKSHILVTELIKGDTLSNIINTCNFNINMFLFIAWQLSNTLSYIHSKNIIHCDLKPENILYDPDNGNIKIIDFGLASYIGCTGVAGTPYYIAPEVWTTGYFSIKSDIWSLGVILYEMLNMKLPYDCADDELETLRYKIIYEEHDPSNSGYHEIDQLIELMLDKNPNIRPNAKDIRNGIESMYDYDSEEE